MVVSAKKFSALSRYSSVAERPILLHIPRRMLSTPGASELPGVFYCSGDCILARINVEDSLFADHRLALLTSMLGRDRAMGQLIYFWKVAQHFWSLDQVIPEGIFKAHRLSEKLIESGFARRVDGGVECCGADRAFGWLKQKRDAAKIGGENSWKGKRRKNKDIGSAADQRNISGDQPLSLSLSLSQKNYSVGGKVLSDLPDEILGESKKIQKSIQSSDQNGKAGKLTAEFIAVVMRAWKKKEPRTRPHIGGKEQGILRRLTKEFSVEDFDKVFQVYLQMKDPWFETKKWDLATFEANLHKITQATQVGTDDNDRFAVLRKKYSKPAIEEDKNGLD